MLTGRKLFEAGDSPALVETAMAFRLHNTLGTQNERYFVAASPTAHSLTCLRIGALVTADAARLATGVGGLALHRTGFAPVGRRTKFHDVIASSLPFDQPCLVAPCTNALMRRGVASDDASGLRQRRKSRFTLTTSPRLRSCENRSGRSGSVLRSSV